MGCRPLLLTLSVLAGPRSRLVLVQLLSLSLLDSNLATPTLRSTLAGARVYALSTVKHYGFNLHQLITAQ